MTLSIYDVSVPMFLRTLRALGRLLDIAAAHCDAHDLPPAELIAARLAPDMNPFDFQIAAAIDNSVGAVARLKGVVAARAEPEPDLAAMSRAVAEAVSWLEAVTPAELEGSEVREIVLPHPRGARHFTGLGYLSSLATPNFFFHTATAYDLLRHQGVQIGKRDFLGDLPPRRPVPA